jgi:superfamily II RNA helicase
MKIVNNAFPITYANDFKIIFSKWPFTLSNFQKWAIYSIYNNYDTLVCAPTGSGKTLPAEFAIDYFTSKGKKVIYTTPIKALSNDKLAELSEKFPHISFGLLTGDNKFNPEAQVLIMTTEIYLNTLLKLMFIKNQPDYDTNKLSLDFSMDIENELGIVIHDEIHYINDRDRGHIWEKSIMNQPKHIPYMGLSATIASPQTLCKWSENPNQANRGEIYLCESKIRNVPLGHYSFITLPDSNFNNATGNDAEMLKEMLNKLVLIKYQDTPFDEKIYDKIKKILKYMYDRKIKIKPSFVFNKAIDYLKQNNLLPTLVFVFSRKQCHVWAKMIQKSLFEDDSKIPSIIEKEAKKILISKLSNWKEYVALPEFREISKLLQKGIAVHHSGVTPVFREMIEILYRKQYIKLLVATETFAIGVNVAIKSVIYTGLKKYDGKGFRFLHSHEYGQGAGRAGRRGKDDKGTIIHLTNIYDNRDSMPPASVYRNMLSGKPQALSSKFCIDFKLIISMLTSGNTDFVKYVNKSMLSNEISAELKQHLDKQSELIKVKKIKETVFKYIQTPHNILQTYYNDTNLLKTASKKKKKVIQRRLTQIQETQRTFHSDYPKYLELLNIENNIKTITKQIDNTNKYIQREIYLHTQILRGEEFVQGEFKQNEYSGLEPTIKGMMAANIHEIHPLAITDILICGDLDNLTVQELVSVLSIFTHIRISQEDAYPNISTTSVNDKIKTAVKQIKNKLNKYYDIESKNQTNFTSSYDIQYDMCDYMFTWCSAENESDCYEIYDNAKKYNIYIGEFVKAILKIVNICNELEKACVIQENIKLLHTLSLVKDKILKSIATNQSLYI